MKPDTPDELRDMLHEWSDVPAPDAGLAARVQREVAAGTSARRTDTGSIIPLRFAVAGLALGVLVGAAAVEWRKSRVEEAEMPQRYLAWIAPLSTSKEMR
jgi:anti-sigma factor RsiW